MSHGGWIKLHRSIIESKVFANAELLKLFVLCLANANYEDRWVDVDGQTKPLLIKRGQFITGRFALHAQYYQNKKRKSQKKPISVWRWLESLAEMQVLELETHNKFTLVTVCNYDTYQNRSDENDQQDDQQMINRRSTDDQQMITTKKDKELKKKKKKESAADVEVPITLQSPAFNAAWAAWLQHLREVPKSVSATAARAQLAELAEWGVDEAVAALQISTKRSFKQIIRPAALTNGNYSNRQGPGQKYQAAGANGHDRGLF